MGGCGSSDSDKPPRAAPRRARGVAPDGPPPPAARRATPPPQSGISSTRYESQVHTLYTEPPEGLRRELSDDHVSKLKYKRKAPTPIAVPGRPPRAECQLVLRCGGRSCSAGDAALLLGELVHSADEVVELLRPPPADWPPAPPGPVSVFVVAPTLGCREPVRVDVASDATVASFASRAAEALRIDPLPLNAGLGERAMSRHTSRNASRTISTGSRQRR
eukprot:TRINITY_DN9904_c0_g1_i1.p1 TRINITY_DN9904_c0_g1~~TRINITY_DN9904_c0_g1_i1.p1  ORF type:complete len:250 (+),score=51.68 TRINITY_DN9904_c0_g1_i1:94-750(+)